MELTATNLIKIPPLERNNYYRYPDTGPYSGEPELYEILHRQEFLEIWGPDHLATYHTCPACGGRAEWIRSEWAICYPCLLAFDAFERYIDLTEEEDMEHMEDE